MFVLSHTFPLLWRFSYLPCFRNCMGFNFTRNRLVRNIKETKTFGIFVFFHNFPVLSKFTMFWVLGTVWISASTKICKKHLTLERFVFSYFLRTFFPFPFPSLAFPRFGDNTTDVKTNEFFYFLSHFHTNIYVKLFINELNLFCS